MIHATKTVIAGLTICGVLCILAACNDSGSADASTTATPIELGEVSDEGTRLVNNTTPSGSSAVEQTHRAGAENHSIRAARSELREVVPDARLDAYQHELLESAFRTASAFPEYPHLKDRERARTLVIDACFELNVPNQGIDFANQIKNWRRGLAYADYALYCVKHGNTDGVDEYLARASDIAAQPEQQWRQHRILSRVAEARLRMGQEKESAAISVDLLQAEKIELESAHAEKGDDGTFDEAVDRLDSMVATQVLESAEAAVAGYVSMFDRHYHDAGRRGALKERAEAAWITAKMPISSRIHSLEQLSNIAVKHGDKKAALAFVDDAQLILERHDWPPHMHYPLIARLAIARYEAGSESLAEGTIESALLAYDDDRSSIFSHERASVLRPMAEAFAVMSSDQKALDLFRRTVEEGAVNQNIRPRANDLTATLVSMATHEVEPDEDLWMQIKEICIELESRR